MTDRKKPILLFDIGNVFLFADHEITYKHLVRQFHISLNRAKRFFKIPEYKQFCRGKINEMEFTQAIKRVLGSNDLSYEQIKKSHNIHIVKPIKSAMKVLNSIYNHSIYQIAFLTDTNAWQNERVKQLVNFSKFSKIIIRSNEEGLTKENPELFRQTLKRFKCKKVLFVDDSLTNIKTAETLGINSLHVAKNNPKLFSALKSKGIILN